MGTQWGRKRHWWAAVSAVLIAGMLSSACCCRPPNLSGVAVTLEAQDRDWWCWAATTEQIARYYGVEAPQCQSANFVHGTPPNCCTGCTGDCDCWGDDWGATIGDIQNNWTNWGFDYAYVADSLTWSRLRKTIATTPNCKKSPIQVVWWWKPLNNNNGGHVVTVYGYAQFGGQAFVSYYNPLPMSCTKVGNQCSTSGGAHGEDAVTSYDAFSEDAGHVWGNSFYNFKVQ